MTFKRSFNVFLDNFGVTYKLMLYRGVIRLIMSCLMLACLYPLFDKLTNNIPLTEFLATIYDSFEHFLRGEFSEIGNISELVSTFIEQTIAILSEGKFLVILMIVIALLLVLVQDFLLGMGSFTAACLVNDKMALMAKTSFFDAYIKNLGKASIYNLLYAPFSLLFSILSVAIAFGLSFFCVPFMPILLKMMLFILTVTLLITIKLVLTCNLLPAIISGKMNIFPAIAYSFKTAAKQIKSLSSTFVALSLIILVVNVTSIVFTFGAAALVSVSASYVLIFATELVFFYDNNKKNYFMDRETIVKHREERTQTRTEFFMGDNND